MPLRPLTIPPTLPSLLFWLVWTGVAGWGFYQALAWSEHVWERRQWPQRPCTVVDHQIRSQETEQGTRYVPLIRCSFARGDEIVRLPVRITQRRSLAQRAAAEERLAAHPVGSDFPVIQDPEDPYHMEPRPGFPWAWVYAVVFGAALMLGARSIARWARARADRARAGGTD